MAETYRTESERLDADDLFAALRQYYNDEAYRFEVPADALDDVVERLREHFYEPVVVEDIDRFCVVKQKYTDHPDVLFKAAVAKQSTGDHAVFLLKDQLSVEQAVEQGATRLADAELEITENSW